MNANYKIVTLPKNKTEWRAAVEAYRTWAKEQPGVGRSNTKNARKKQKHKAGEEPMQLPVLIDFTWTLEDLDVLTSASKIETAQFLMLRVLFPDRSTGKQTGSIENRELISLEELGVISKTAAHRAKTTLASDSAFNYMLMLVSEDRLLSRDDRHDSAERLGRFLLVRRYLDFLHRSRWAPARPTSPAPSPKRTRAAAANQRQASKNDIDTSRVIVFASPRKEKDAAGTSKYQSGLGTLGPQARRDKEEAVRDEDEGKGSGDDDNDENDEDDEDEGDEGDNEDEEDNGDEEDNEDEEDSEDGEDDEDKKDDENDSTFHSQDLPAYAEDDSRAELESSLRQYTSDETKCLVFIVNLLNALYLSVEPELEAVPEQRLFRIRQRVDSGHSEDSAARDRSLLAAKVDAVVSWRDEEGRNNINNVLSIVEVKRHTDDTIAVNMQHAAEIVAFVAEKTRDAILSASTQKQMAHQQKQCPLSDGHAVLICQNFTTVRLRIGMYDSTFIEQLHVRSSGRQTRSSRSGPNRGDQPDPGPEEGFLSIYSSYTFNLTQEVGLRQLCEVLLALGITFIERRDKTADDQPDID